MFTISYVVVTVKARLEGMDRHIEEAAMDLGATEWTTFIRVTLPLIAPGVAAAALLAGAISIDDYVITSFNAGQTQTFPLFIFGATRQGVPPEVNVLATMLLLVVLGLMAANVLAQRARTRRETRVSADAPAELPVLEPA
jgi:spermidine/putrescine transport system permease protein